MSTFRNFSKPPEDGTPIWKNEWFIAGVLVVVGLVLGYLIGVAAPRTPSPSPSPTVTVTVTPTPAPEPDPALTVAPK